jgi:aminoglycoside phosphotransferase (APT) family kinase protein
VSPAITPALVAQLLRGQHPDLADQALQPGPDHGWDNVVFRLGTELAVRLPRRPLAAPLIEHELAWLPVLAPRLPLLVPAVVRAGAPGAGYLWPWSVNRWVPGEPMGTRAPAGAGAALAGFLRALHRPAPPTAPGNPYRGVPLADRLPRSEHHADALLARGEPAGPWLHALHEAAAAPAFQGPPHWFHGDLHPANVLTDGSAVTGVIDFGDLGAGDPAVDLAIAWMLPAHQRPPLKEHARTLDASGATWHRGRGWAIAMALAVLAHPAPGALLTEVARFTLAQAAPS